MLQFRHDFPDCYHQPVPRTVEQRHLPRELLDRASLRHGEYAWPVTDIPLVIETVRRANLANVGGQLQFRFHDATICECYWVEVDTYKVVPQSLSWNERVAQTAAAALAGFLSISEKYDFLEQGRCFTKIVGEEARGLNLQEAMCFVWYVDAEPG
jgi:hypothetical protein